MIPTKAWMDKGTMAIIVRRRFDFLKHSANVTPSVSCRMLSRDTFMEAKRDSISEGVCPRLRNARAAFLSLPRETSHQGDLRGSERGPSSLLHNWRSYSGIKGSPMRPIAVTPYWDTKIPRYAHRVFKSPYAFVRRVTINGPRVYDRPAAAVTTPRSG